MEVMRDLPSTLELQSEQAHHKVAGTRRPLAFLVSSMLAGMYVGVAVVLMVSTAGPFAAAGDPAVRLISGGVFAVALVLVVFAGAELVTSAMMILTQGAITGRIPWLSALGTMLFCFLGNLVGSMLFGALVVASGVLQTNAAAGAMVASLLEMKAGESVGALVARGILCNILVCVAIWACTRLRSEAGKAIVIFWCLFAFISSGFEHVVANMTTFSLGVFAPEALTTWGEFARNMLAVGFGNLLGGAIVVGVGYTVASGWRPGPRPTDHPDHGDSAGTAGSEARAADPVPVGAAAPTLAG